MARNGGTVGSTALGLMPNHHCVPPASHRQQDARPARRDPGCGPPPQGTRSPRHHRPPHAWLAAPPLHGLLVQPLARVQPSRISHMWPKGLPVQPPLLRLSGADTASRGRLADTGSIPHCAWKGGLSSAAHKRARSGATRLRLSHPASRCHRQGGWWGVAVVALPRPGEGTRPTLTAGSP